MKHSVLLTITSLLSLLLFTIHVADDVVRGIDTFGLVNLIGVAIFVVWLYGALLLSERRSGHIIMLLGALFATLAPVLHMKNAPLSDAFLKSDGAILWIWTLWALAVTATFSVILAARGLWSLRRSQAR